MRGSGLSLSSLSFRPCFHFCRHKPPSRKGSGKTYHQANSDDVGELSSRTAAIKTFGSVEGRIGSLVSARLGFSLETARSRRHQLFSATLGFHAFPRSSTRSVAASRTFV